MASSARAARLLPFLLLALLLPPAPASAQFGKNKVQYDTFDWFTIETDHFDIYYYKEEEESAVIAARMAERAYTRFSRILNHEIEDRVPVIIYASHTDFQQTNITPTLISEGTGGITEFSKRRVFLPFTGSYGEFDHVLSHELVHAFQVDLMFGSGAEANPFSFQPPLWFMEGMAEYLSIGGIDPNTEMWLRWSALEGQLVPLQYMDRVFDIRVYRIGQAIFDFVGERYGDEKIGELLRKTVYYRSADIAFEKTLGMDLETLNDEWEEYVKRKYYPQIVDLNRPEEHGRRLFGRKGFSGVHVAPSLSPNGERLVYIKDGRFSKNIELVSAIDGKDLGSLVEGERSGDFESLRYMYTAIGWSPDGGRIAFPSKKGGEDVLNILDVDQRKVLQTFSFDFDALYSPAYHPSGRRIVFAGIRGGKSDLFLLDTDTQELIQVTDDPFLARDPQFSPDGRRIAFVTDRGPGTDLDKLSFSKPKVAILDVASGRIELMPGQKGKSIAPHWGPDGEHVAFVSDRDGVSNLYVQDLRTDSVYRLTNLVTGVTGLIDSSPPFSWSRNGERIVFTTFVGAGWELYGIDDPLHNMEEIKTPEPLERIARREQDSIVPWDTPSLLVDGGAGVLPNGAAAAKPVPAEAVAQLAVATPDGPGEDTVAAAHQAGAEESPERVGVDLASLLAPPATALGLAGPGAPGKPVVQRAAQDPDASLVLANVLQETQGALPDPATLETKPYKLRWAPDFIGASPFFASSVGFAGSATIAISDILSNHIVQIGASVYGSIDESDLFLGYYNQKNRTNWGFAAYQYRNDFATLTGTGFGLESRIVRGVQGTLSRPFSKFSRAEFVARGVHLDTREFDPITGRREDGGSDFFYGPEVALVTDTVTWGYMGPVHGHRARISHEQAFHNLRFNTTIGDYRRYIPLGGSTVWATRLIGGVSAGPDPQHFRAGGPYTLRGLDYSELEGDNVALISTELRFPLVETLRLGWPLRIGLGGIGGVLFFDAGGAFGDSPRIMTDGALDDVAAGYGFGFRLGLGYFALRYDVAWETDLKATADQSEDYFTIGVDF